MDYLPAGLSQEMLEYETLEAERQVYSRGSDQLTVTLYRMKDPSGAYGAYSFLRTEDMRRAQFTEHSAASPSRALILTGNLLLDVSGPILASVDADLRALIQDVTAHAAQGLYPDLWQHLPTEGFVERSDRYFLGPIAFQHETQLASGDWLGFSAGAEAELAHYRIRGQEMTLVLADFPTPQVAEQRLKQLSNMFDVEDTSASPDTTPASDARPRIFAKRDLTLLAIVLNARSQKDADAILSRVHSGTELTWNEPSFEFSDPSVGRMLVGVFVGTGVLCLFVLVASLAFGGFRLAVKRLAPGALFDRPSSMDILQLGLSSKPIDSKDFYSK